ncbi:MAG: hypothetical protein EXS25_09360 [Pedosphaera sp.]|nr:hypothetical protein [Pedosphaera sp.]
MAARSLLLKLEGSGLIRIPPSLRLSVNGQRYQIPLPAHVQPIGGTLHDQQPLKVGIVISGSAMAKVFQPLLAYEH